MNCPYKSSDCFSAVRIMSNGENIPAWPLPPDAKRIGVKTRLIRLKAEMARWFKGHEGRRPIICVFGAAQLELATPVAADYEEQKLDCRCYVSDADLEWVLVKDKPDVLITIGERSLFPRVAQAPLVVRRRWLHYDALPDVTRLGIDAYACYLGHIFKGEKLEGENGNESPLVTVFTPAYNPGEKIYRPFRSLREQTYGNWEWIIVDDSDDDGSTFKTLRGLAKKDHRIQVFKPWAHSGVIGRVKNWACSLGQGPILVELDHDDELTDYALELVVRGFEQFPQAGFLYTDCAEVLADGRNSTYRPGWAFGYGSYTDVEYRGRLYKSANACNINSKTIRHIISAPNHIRAWRRSFYDSIGGHNKDLHVADDYEILVRTFLNTRMVRVPKLCYIQLLGNTAQQARNGDIHRHVCSIRRHYDREIHDRFLELGCEDFIWDEEKGGSDFSLPNPEAEPHVTLIARF